MNFPSTCVDNFYANPDLVRQFALTQNYTKADNGQWPGKRTELLHILNQEMFNQFANKLFSIFYDFTTTTINWEISSSFQLVESLSEIEDDVKNTGWIHTDNSSGVLAGVIYLSPNARLTTGTSVYNQIDSSTIDNTDVKEKFYLHGIDDGTYNQRLLKHNSGFVETTRYNNIYNRLVLWDGAHWHGANSYYSPNGPRLTQVFFVNRVESNSNPPLNRFKINL